MDVEFRGISLCVYISPTPPPPPTPTPFKKNNNLFVSFPVMLENLTRKTAETNAVLQTTYKSKNLLTVV